MDSRLLCHVLSNILKISKNKLLTSTGGLLSKLVWISWIMARSSAVHESPRRRQDSEGLKILLPISKQRIIGYLFKYFEKNRE